MPSDSRNVHKLLTSSMARAWRWTMFLARYGTVLFLGGAAGLIYGAYLSDLPASGGRITQEVLHASHGKVQVLRVFHLQYAVPRQGYHNLSAKEHGLPPPPPLRLFRLQGAIVRYQGGHEGIVYQFPGGILTMGPIYASTNGANLSQWARKQLLGKQQPAAEE